MPYSLRLEGTERESRYVPSYEFPGTLDIGDTFDFEGSTWRVSAVAVKQFDVPGEPPETLRCVRV
jgi:hypothetical protein